MGLCRRAGVVTHRTFVVSVGDDVLTSDSYVNYEASPVTVVEKQATEITFALAGSSTMAVTDDNRYTALTPQKVPSVHLSKTSSGSPGGSALYRWH